MQLFKNSKTSTITALIISLLVIGGGIYLLLQSIIIASIIIILLGLAIFVIAIILLVKPNDSCIATKDCLIFKNVLYDLDSKSINYKDDLGRLIIPNKMIQGYEIVYSKKIASVKSFFTASPDLNKQYFDIVIIYLSSGIIKVYLSSINQKFLTNYLKKLSISQK